MLREKVKPFGLYINMGETSCLRTHRKMVYVFWHIPQEHVRLAAIIQRVI